jgi:hypothetical protein
MRGATAAHSWIGSWTFPGRFHPRRHRPRSEPRLSYATPAAFRRALTDRLRAAPSPWPLADLQRQFAYDRLLVRLYLLDDAWIVKGATALLARGVAVRHTIDIDVYRPVGKDQAEHDLRAALTLDAGDWFHFEAAPSIPIMEGTLGVRIPVNAKIGTATWAGFHVDLLADNVRMTGLPDEVPSLTRIDMPGLVHRPYRAYPLVDHIADKTCAILERLGPARRPSSRFKDLIDLVVLVAHATPTAAAQRAALVSEAARRGFPLPSHFEVPDLTLWTAGYAAEAKRARRFTTRTLDEALAAVRPYLDPILSDTATGRWHPDRAAWEP